MRHGAALLLVVVLTACGGAGDERTAPSTTLRDGDRVSYEPGEVERGETRIVCKGDGDVSAAAIVPEDVGKGVSGSGDGPDGGASIDVKVAPDGTVTASCDAG